MLIAALFTVARILKQPKFPLKDEWIKKMWHIHIYIYIHIYMYIYVCVCVCVCACVCVCEVSYL